MTSPDNGPVVVEREKARTSGLYPIEIAFADYDRTGVGAAVNGDTVYVAQLFASNLGGTAGRDPKSGATEFPSAEAARKADSGATATPPLRLRGAESGPSN